MYRLKHVLPLILMSATLAGCGLTVPEMQEFYQDRADEQLTENIIINQIQCELRKGVQDTLDDYSARGAHPGKSVEWLRDWAAKVNLKITVDEKSTVSPGVSVAKPFENAVSHFRVGGAVTTAQMFSLGLGLQASSDATRVESIGFTYVFKDLLKKRLDHPCGHVSNILIESDLKIGEFIKNKAFIARVPGTVNGKADSSPYTVFSDEITFVVVYGGSATPTWKFLDVTGNTTSPFFNATRTRTHDVTITMGPVQGAPGPVQVTAEVDAVHLANLIGQAVATSIQSQQH